MKPNAGLTELLRTAKSDLHKLSSKDAAIVIGGSNDIGKSELKSNLTSITKFLDDLQQGFSKGVPRNFWTVSREKVLGKCEHIKKSFVYIKYYTNTIVISAL